MTLRKLPEAKTFARPQNFQWDAPSDVLTKWAEKPLAAADGQDNTVTIYDVIGEDWWTGGGFTAKRMAAALRSIGKNDVVVNINSPGGDMFEGIAIYNMLREHEATRELPVTPAQRFPRCPMPTQRPARKRPMIPATGMTRPRRSPGSRSIMRAGGRCAASANR